MKSSQDDRNVTSSFLIFYICTVKSTDFQNTQILKKCQELSLLYQNCIEILFSSMTLNSPLIIHEMSANMYFL